jgi:hypothetical protein
MPQVMNTMIVDLVPALLGRRTAHFGMGAGAKTLGDADTELDDALSLAQGKRLRIGIGHDEIHAFKPGFDHIVNGVAATTANTKHGDAGLELLDIRNGEVDGHKRPHSGVVDPDLPTQVLIPP